MIIKKSLKISIWIISFTIVVELLLRSLGLGNPPLYVSDEHFEYIYAPNQEIFRFGNRILVNEYGMRSKPIGKENNKITILKIGDSVINGGAPTDHDSLSTTILEKKLQQQFNKEIRVLNISAGSWGPDNAMAFIKKHGNFNASKIVLVFNSHDLYDIMTFEELVGKNINYPSRKPAFAMIELYKRYLKDKLFNIENSTSNESTKLNADSHLNTSVQDINPGWFFFPIYCKNNNIELLVILHPTKGELMQKEYNVYGKQIIHILDSLKVPYKLEINNGITEDMYRDKIHLNNKGQKFLEKLIYPELVEHIKMKLNAKN